MGSAQTDAVGPSTSKMRFFMTHAFEQNVVVLSGGAEKPWRRRNMDRSHGSNTTRTSDAETATSSMTRSLRSLRSLSSRCCLRGERAPHMDDSLSASGSDSQSLDISIHSMLAASDCSKEQQRQALAQHRRLLSRAKPGRPQRQMSAAELLKLASLSQREGMSAAELLRSLQEIHESCATGKDETDAAAAAEPAAEPEAAAPRDDPYSTLAQLVR